MKRLSLLLKTALPCSSIVIVTFAVFVSPYATWANPQTPTCIQTFQILAMHDLDLKSPALARFIASRSMERLARDQPPGFKMIEESIASLRGDGAVGFTVDTDGVTAGLSVRKADGELSVTIDYVTLASGPGAADKLNMGERNNSLSMGFPRLLTAIAAGVNRQVARDESIQKVTLGGKFVINQHLAEELHRLGFVPGVSQASWRQWLAQSKRGDATAVGKIGNWLVLLATSAFSQRTPEFKGSPLMKGINGLSVATMTGLKIRTARANSLTGKDWKLELNLERPDVTAQPVTPVEK